MASLKFLVRGLSSRSGQEELVILRRLFISSETIIRNCPQEVGGRRFGQEMRSGIQSADCQLVMLVLMGCLCQITIAFWKIAFLLKRFEQLRFCLRIFALVQKGVPEP